MALDFTLRKYTELLKSIMESGYEILTVERFLNKSKHKRVVVLRHDVDKRPLTSLLMATIEHKLGVNSTYYFRLSTFKPKIVARISSLGHEVGYHYEVVDKSKGDLSKAWRMFKQELGYMRKFVSIVTASQHGNPLSKWNNLSLWDSHDFHEVKLIGEAYLSFMNINITYVSDTGMSWSSHFSVKDTLPTAVSLKNTDELIRRIQQNNENFYILVHPDKWSISFFGWCFNISTQSAKNLIKFLIKRVRA